MMHQASSGYSGGSVGLAGGSAGGAGRDVIFRLTVQPDPKAARVMRMFGEDMKREQALIATEAKRTAIEMTTAYTRAGQESTRAVNRFADANVLRAKDIAREHQRAAAESSRAWQNTSRTTPGGVPGGVPGGPETGFGGRGFGRGIEQGIGGAIHLGQAAALAGLINEQDTQKVLDWLLGMQSVAHAWKGLAASPLLGAALAAGAAAGGGGYVISEQLSGQANDPRSVSGRIAEQEANFGAWLSQTSFGENIWSLAHNSQYQSYRDLAESNQRYREFEQSNQFSKFKRGQEGLYAGDQVKRANIGLQQAFDLESLHLRTGRGSDDERRSDVLNRQLNIAQGQRNVFAALRDSSTGQAREEYGAQVLNLDRERRRLLEEMLTVQQKIGQEQIRGSQAAINNAQKEIDLRKTLIEAEQKRYQSAKERFGAMSPEEQQRLIQIQQRMQYANYLQSTGSIADRVKAEQIKGQISEEDLQAVGALGTRDEGAFASRLRIERAERAGFDEYFGGGERREAERLGKEAEQYEVKLNNAMTVKADLEASVPVMVKSIVDELAPLIVATNRQVLDQLPQRLTERLLELERQIGIGKEGRKNKGTIIGGGKR